MGTWCGDGSNARHAVDNLTVMHRLGMSGAGEGPLDTTVAGAATDFLHLAGSGDALGARLTVRLAG